MGKRKRSAGLGLEQVAQGIGLSLAEVQVRVQRSGADALLAPDGRVPLDALDALVAKVKAAEASPSGQGLLRDAAGLEALMQRSGVQRLERAPAKPKRSPAPAQEAQASAAPATRPPEPAPARPAPTISAPAHRAPAPPPQRASVIRGDLLAAPATGGRREDVLREQLSEAEQQLTRLREKLSAAQSREAELDQALRESARALEAERARATALEYAQRISEPSPAPEPEVAPGSLSQLLLERGLKGEDEGAAAVRSLMQARRWEQVASQLAPVQPELLRALLRERLVLHCGRAECTTPPASVPVKVAAARCECCGGGDIGRSLRRLGDALLLNGLRRVAVLGLSPAWGRVLSEHLDARVEVSLVEGAPEPQAQALLSWRAALPEGLDEGLLMLRSEARSLAGFADDVTGALQ